MDETRKDEQAASDLGEFEIQEVKYSLPIMLRELQLERSQSHFAKEIIDQIEITKIFAQARKARSRGKQL
ncbi:MAG: hypothetical protein ACREIA_21900 [Opitutaceae bacterium]